jgi:hypothetical protein
MKIYVAGSYAARKECQATAKRLILDGHQVTSTWHDPDNPLEMAWDHDYRGHIANALAFTALYSIDQADLVLIDNTVSSTTGGLHVELGYSWANHKKIVLIGPTTSIFLSLITEHYDNLDEALRRIDWPWDHDYRRKGK